MTKQDENLKKMLSREIQKEEIKKAIASLKNGKSFGVDAVPGEIYKYNETVMTDILYEIYKEIYNEKTEMGEMNEGPIVLLHKNGEKTKTDNYRPITLVNVIYKIIAIIITRRIAPIMNILTDEKQTAYKSNRATTDILSIIETYTRRMKKGEEKEKSITLIDLSKAFDRANRQNIYSILAKTGVPIELIKIIRKTHTRTKLAPKEQNKIGRKTESNIGVYQGSPLSALLFIIYTNQMMKEYEKEWEKEKEEEKKKGFTRQREEKIRVRNEKEEIKYTKNKAQELEREKGGTKYKEEELDTDNTRTTELDQLQYADDTTFFNHYKRDEEKKLTIYKKIAEKYDLLIQWKNNNTKRKSTKRSKNSRTKRTIQ